MKEYIGDFFPCQDCLIFPFFCFQNGSAGTLPGNGSKLILIMSDPLLDSLPLTGADSLVFLSYIK